MYMKNYKDMADAVFRRRDEYAESLKRKKQKALNIGLSLCAVCLAVLGAFGIWKTGVLEPDPNILGTKPHSVTEATELTINSLASNATSEGGNTEPTEATVINKVTKPQTGPQVTVPVVLPTLPQLPGPGFPIKPNKPTSPLIPEVPTTNGDPIESTPNTQIVTDPVEWEPQGSTSATDGNDSNQNDIPCTNDSTKPTKPPKPSTTPNLPVPDVTAATDAPDIGRPDEAPGFEEPTESVETTLPSVKPIPTEPTMSPETECPTAQISVYGKIIDQNGKAVKGAAVTLYNNGTAISTVKTDSNGNYTFTDVDFSYNLYVKQSFAPSGYTCATNTVYLTNSNNYIVFVSAKS